MVLFRALGWLLLGLSLAVVVRDGLFWWSDGVFHPTTLGELWLQVDFGSQKAFEALVIRHFSVLVWVQLGIPLLKIPALPVFVIVGLFLLWIGQRSDDRPEPGFVLGARPPRRKRGRSTLS